jgi:hypothetical protein
MSSPTNTVISIVEQIKKYEIVNHGVLELYSNTVSGPLFKTWYEGLLATK